MTRFVPSAAAFIRRERNYLRQRSPAAVRHFLADIASVVEMLDVHPDIGTPLAALRDTPLAGIRRWIKDGYSFDYELDADGRAIVILVRHQAQDDPFLFFVPDDTDED
jgi:plasmid stabilization system protein ParE